MSKQVLLTTDAPSLQFEDPKRQAKFELGVACAVFLWDDLATAVASGWGGPESAAKREWLAGAIVDLFNADEVATEDVEYRLLMAMIDEFDVTVETGSAQVVAEQVIRVYQECAEDNYTTVNELYNRYQQQQPVEGVRVQDEDGDGSEDEDESNENAMDVEEPVEPSRGRREPEVDEDGFIIVKGR